MSNFFQRTFSKNRRNETSENLAAKEKPTARTSMPVEAGTAM